MLLKEPLLSDFPKVCTFQWRSHAEVLLGPVRIDIRSNEPQFKGLRFFSQFHAANHGDPERIGTPDFTLNLCNLTIDTPWPLHTLAATHDRNYRARKMSAGYYLTDHFGAPAYLLSRGTEYWIFAENFEPILWPYAVKHLLTVYAMKSNLLHLKAAAIVVDGQGALLVGRGGGGKTVLLTQLCRAGAEFLSNTHVLLAAESAGGHRVLGIPTAMRVRPDAVFTPIIAERGLSPSVKAGEYTADPLRDLGWSAVSEARVHSICLLDYQGSRRRTIREMSGDVLFNYMEQFAHAINVYGLKEDILDALGADVNQFAQEMTRIRTHLRSLVEASRCYYLSCDAADPRNLREIRALL